MFIEPPFESSFKGTNIGNYLYSYVCDKKPKLIIELGVLNGFSTSCFLQAIHDLPHITRIISVDLFNLYEFNRCSIDTYVSNVSKYYSSNSQHSIVQCDVFAINFHELSNLFGPVPYNQILTFIDISNDANSLSTLFKRIKSPILFEGGTLQRDNVPWMLQYEKVPINSLRSNGTHYEIVCDEFPGLSLLNR